MTVHNNNRIVSQDPAVGAATAQDTDNVQPSVPSDEAPQNNTGGYVGTDTSSPNGGTTTVSHGPTAGPQVSGAAVMAALAQMQIGQGDKLFKLLPGRYPKAASLPDVLEQLSKGPHGKADIVGLG